MWVGFPHNLPTHPVISTGTIYTTYGKATSGWFFAYGIMKVWKSPHN